MAQTRMVARRCSQEVLAGKKKASCCTGSDDESAVAYFRRQHLSNKEHFKSKSEVDLSIIDCIGSDEICKVLGNDTF